MGKITALKTNKRTDRQVNLYLDGKFAVKLDTELAVKKGLKVGEEISDGRIKELTEDVG